jgi:hypothetical protein
VKLLLADAYGCKRVLQKAQFLLLTVQRMTQVTCNTRAHILSDAATNPKLRLLFRHSDTPQKEEKKM